MRLPRRAAPRRARRRPRRARALGAGARRSAPARSATSGSCAFVPFVSRSGSLLSKATSCGRSYVRDGKLTYGDKQSPLTHKLNWPHKPCGATLRAMPRRATRTMLGFILLLSSASAFVAPRTPLAPGARPRAGREPRCPGGRLGSGEAAPPTLRLRGGERKLSLRMSIPLGAFPSM